MSEVKTDFSFSLRAYTSVLFSLSEPRMFSKEISLPYSILINVQKIFHHPSRLVKNLSMCQMFQILFSNLIAIPMSISLIIISVSYPMYKDTEFLIIYIIWWFIMKNPSIYICGVLLLSPDWLTFFIVHEY